MRSLLVVLCTFFSINSFAAGLIDSVGVENSNGNQVIVHKVIAKETYYSIGRLYGVLPRDIIALNNNTPLQIGLILKVPTKRPFITSKSTVKPVQQVNTSAPAEEIEEYKVGPKETLFAISKKFNTTIEEIKQLNNLKSNSLSLGQVLKIKRKPDTIKSITPDKPQSANSAIPETVATPATTETTEIPVEKPKIATGRLGVTERSERGVAVWIADENLDGTKMLALHRTAPVGTVVKITNPMTDRTTFAKVVGRFTENETTKDVIIVLTKATADLLGALDKRFQVSIDYGVPNE